MFQDLDATLKAMLSDPAAPSEVRAADVSFDTPDKEFNPSQTTVDLFLHDVQENRDLRDQVPLVDKTDGGFVVRHRPLRVDCTYLVTVWSTQSAGLKAAEEHRLLGLVLLWLSRFEVVEPHFLRGDLTMPPQLYPLPLTMAQMKEGQGMGQFWTALGVAPRLAFSLTVTIGLQPFDEAATFPAPKTIEIRPTVSDEPALCGRVLDATLAPLPGTPVTIVENGAAATSDSFGSFTFRELAFGSYTLLVRVAGHPDLRKPVQYTAQSQIHDVIVPAA
ncbi:Pvc16 family protein [Streptomyces sp. NPDC052109]|uniref:Pvc16 family protein n=1 Tax=Streptomyces sp. NPDC052109 TaxID=3155527 RepID=UPI00341D069C